jgi:hypothetical protein
MTDVKLEVIDLSTGTTIATLQFDICAAKTLEFEIGDYRFIATYLLTGEVQQADRSIVEGENPPLEFVFTPAPLTVDVNPKSARLDVNKTQTFTATVTGGIPPYSIEWYDNVTGELIGTGDTYTFTATEYGKFEIYAQVTDNTGGKAKSSVVPIYVVAILIEDNFNDNTLDTNLWRIFRPVGKVYERNMRIEIEPLEIASGIRLRNRIDFRDFFVYVDGDTRRARWIELTVGYNPACENDWRTLSWEDTYYTMRLYPTKVIEIYRREPGKDRVCPWVGTASQFSIRMGIRIERHPDYPTEERYIIRFYDGETELYNEECTWLINAIGGMGVVELLGREGSSGFDNFEVRKASAPEPTKYTLTMQELADTNGVVYPCGGTYKYSEGSQVSIAATPNTGYIFNGWIINGVPNYERQLILIMDKNVTIQSNGFSRDPSYRLLTIINNLGGKTDLPSGVNAFPIGQIVTVTATPELVSPGIMPKFKQWLLDGQPAGASPTISVDMSDDHTLEPTWTYPVPSDTWFLRVADILPDTPPAPPLDGPNFDTILDDIVAHNTERKEVNFAETRCCWWWDEVNDPTGNNPVIRESPPYEPTLEQIRGAIRKIKAHGLKAAIYLIPAYRTRHPYRSRPPGFDPELFIENYFKNCAIPLAKLCQEEGADMLVLGGEMEDPQAATTDENERDWALGHNEKRIWGLNEVRKVFKGILSYNIQGWYTPDGFANAKQMLFLQHVDVIMVSDWRQMDHLPVDPRDVAWGLWLNWMNAGVNFMDWYKEFSTVMGKKVYLNSGYGNWTGSILSPWAGPPETGPMDPQEQRFAWRGALQAMRWQPWCAGYDMERYNENQVSHPPPYRSHSWRYHPENQDAIFKELNETLTAQLPPTEATLTILVQPPEGGKTSPAPGSHTYPIGTSVDVLASPTANYTFDHWTLDGNYIGKMNPVTVIMDTDHTLTAYFTPLKPLKPMGILAWWWFPICSRIPNVPPCPFILEWAKRHGYLQSQKG